MGRAAEYCRKCSGSLSQRPRDVECNPGVGGHCTAQVLVGIPYVRDLIGLLILKEAKELDISRLRRLRHGGGQGINAAGLEGLVLNCQASFQRSQAAHDSVLKIQYRVGSDRATTLFRHCADHQGVPRLVCALPGYAQTLLNIADGGSKVLEWASRVGEPVVAAGLAFHGAFLYMGLGASLMAFTVSRSLGAIASLSTKAAIAARDSTLLGSAGTFASKGLFALGSCAESAAALPWGWIVPE